MAVPLREAKWNFRSMTLNEGKSETQAEFSEFGRSIEQGEIELPNESLLTKHLSIAGQNMVQCLACM